MGTGTKMIIGIDDTDSNEGMCTTYLGALLLEELQQYGTITERPLLIRLNPTIPYKTRGNAAVALRISTEYPEKVMEHVISRVRALARLECEKTNPGVVFVPDEASESLKPVLGKFLKQAVREVLTIESAKKLISKFGIPAQSFKNGRGLIGALAACGAMLNNGHWDHTYEYLTYRQQKAWGTPRFVDRKSLCEADKATYPKTWDTVDHANKLVVCVPHSGDPVLFGIRGNSPAAVTEAASLVRGEAIERFALYKTNQGTDMHLIDIEKVAEIQDMHSYRLEGKVAKLPATISGGHVIFSIRDGAGDELACAAYEPTKNFRALIRKLIPGDWVVLSGSVKEKTLNVEKIEIKELAVLYTEENPRCPACGKHMKSAGVGQGFRCKKCGSWAGSKARVEIHRSLLPGRYEVPPCARRHLAKPLARELEETGPDAGVFPAR